MVYFVGDYSYFTLRLVTLSLESADTVDPGHTPLSAQNSALFSVLL
jgi:hypothetical protein